VLLGYGCPNADRRLPRKAHQTKQNRQRTRILFEEDKALEIEVTFDTLFEANNRKANCTLSDCFQREIARLKSLGKLNSASKVKTVYSLACLFRNPNIRLEEIDIVYLNDFELFLRNRDNVDNSIATKFTVLKAIYNKALNEELFTPKSNPFVRFKVGRLWTATRKRAITKEELSLNGTPSNDLTCKRLAIGQIARIILFHSLCVREP
jgi:hypothetical protein